MESCKNCQNNCHENDKFCSQCGQKTGTHHIDFHFLIHEIQHGIFHIDSGIFYTLKELFTRPGHSIREYIEGKRKKHFKPILLIMVLGTIFTLLAHWLEKKDWVLGGTIDIKLDNSSSVNNFIQYITTIFSWINGHFSLYKLFLVPLFALAFYGVFKKFKRYNYAEWLVIITFISGQMIVVSIIDLWVNTLLKGRLDFVFSIIEIVILLWTLMQLFPSESKKSIIWRSLVSLLLSGMIYVTALAIIVGIGAILHI